MWSTWHSEIISGSGAKIISGLISLIVLAMPSNTSLSLYCPPSHKDKNKQLLRRVGYDTSHNRFPQIL